MKNMLRVRYTLLTVSFGLLAVLQAHGQMKIGNHPTQIHPASILELESDRQGLLLTRVDDFDKINTVIATANVDGMIIYYTGAEKGGPGLYVRKDDDWLKVASANEATSNWKLTGNAGTDPATDFIGTTDGQPLVIKTDGQERLRVTAAGRLQAATGTITTSDDNNELKVLVLGDDGTINMRELPADVFASVVTGIKDKAGNRITNTDATFSANADTKFQKFEVVADADADTISINAPIMDGTGAKTYGFMTKTDWDKLKNLQGINKLSIGDLILTAANDPEDARGAKITDDGNGNYEIRLIEADATHNGIVTTGDQTFAGKKTFNGNTTIGDGVTEASLTVQKGTTDLYGNTTIGNGTEAANLTVEKGTTILKGETTIGEADEAKHANLTVNGALSTAVKVVTGGGNWNMTTAGNEKYRTIIVDFGTALSGNSTVTLPPAVDGRIYTIKKMHDVDGTDPQNPHLDCTIDITGGTIEDGLSYIIRNDYSSVTLQAQGGKWYIVSK